MPISDRRPCCWFAHSLRNYKNWLGSPVESPARRTCCMSVHRLAYTAIEIEMWSRSRRREASGPPDAIAICKRPPTVTLFQSGIILVLIVYFVRRIRVIRLSRDVYPCVSPGTAQTLEARADLPPCFSGLPHWHRGPVDHLRWHSCVRLAPDYHAQHGSIDVIRGSKGMSYLQRGRVHRAVEMDRLHVR
jgi:hypothetical protein